MLAALALLGAAAAPAQADGVQDIYCPPGQTVCSSYPYWIIQDGAGRCDATLKFIGGNASAVMFRFANYGAGDIETPWSNWLRLNETFSKAAWRFDVGYAEIWKAQADRGASYRLRVTGPCHVQMIT